MGKSRTSGIAKTSSGIGIGGGGGLVGGGGASTSAGGASVQAQVQQNQQVQQQQNQPNQTIQTTAQDLVDASKVASIYGNNTSAMFATMTDDQMAQAVKNSVGVDMPYHINDRPDTTQNFTFANGLNAKPTVLDDAEFDNYIKQNKISSNEYLIREVDPISFTSNGVSYKYTADDVTDMFKTSDINYIAGKHGGQVWGAGSYFGMGDFNHVTGYGSGADGVGHKTMVAVFDKSKAKAIYGLDIRNQWAKFSVTHPKTAKAVSNLSGSTSSIKALLMGYNVITSNSRGSLKGGYDEYYNIIDRSALVVRANNRK